MSQPVTDIPFTRVNCTGNELVLVDALGENQGLLDLDWSAMAPLLCAHTEGIPEATSAQYPGADGVIILSDGFIEKQTQVASDACFQFFNPDGSRSNICINAFRGATQYLVQNEKTQQDISKRTLLKTRRGVKYPYQVIFSTAFGNVWTRIIGISKEQSTVEVEVHNLPQPHFTPSEIPLLVDVASQDEIITNHRLNVGGTQIEVACVNVGNPHAVLFTEEPLSYFDLNVLGPQVENHPDFPEKVNFSIARVVDAEYQNLIELMTWERGVGWSRSCGSASCAAVITAKIKGLIRSHPVATVGMVRFAEGASLKVSISNRSHRPTVSGPTKMYHHGSFRIPPYALPPLWQY